jgi:hypothetical protein
MWSDRLTPATVSLPIHREAAVVHVHEEKDREKNWTARSVYDFGQTFLQQQTCIESKPLCHGCLLEHGCTRDVAQQDIILSKRVRLYMSAAAGVVYAFNQVKCFSGEFPLYQTGRALHTFQVKYCTSKARHFRRTICTLNG